MRYLIVICSLCILCASASTRVAGATIIIDSFQDLEGPVISAGETLLPQSFPHVIGARGLGVKGTTPEVGVGGGTFAPVEVDIDSPTDTNSLKYKGFGNAGKLTLSYGGAPPFMPPAPMSLSVNPAADSLQLTFSSYTRSPGQEMSVDTFLQTLLDPTGVAGPITSSESTTLTVAGAQTLEIPLSQFAANRLDYVSFTFNAPAGTDFQLASVALVKGVPEPKIGGPIVVAVTLLARRRQRRAIRA